MSKILVHEVEPDVFVRWPSGQKVYRTCDTETVIVRRLDGTSQQSDRKCEPYEAEVRFSEDTPVAWDDAELALHKLYWAERFVVPEGKVVTGPPSYDRNGKGVVVETYAVEDRPAPPTAEERAQRLIREMGFDKATDALAAIGALAEAEGK